MCIKWSIYIGLHQNVLLWNLSELITNVDIVVKRKLNARYEFWNGEELKMLCIEKLKKKTVFEIVGISKFSF